MIIEMFFFSVVDFVWRRMDFEAWINSPQKLQLSK